MILGVSLGETGSAPSRVGGCHSPDEPDLRCKDLKLSALRLISDKLRLIMTNDERAMYAEPERELINLLRENGASDIFITVIRNDPDEMGVSKNSALAEINKWVRWNDGEIDEGLLKRPGFGGGFFEKLWNGRLYEAYRHGDQANKQLLRLLFGISKINKARPAGYSKVTA